MPDILIGANGSEITLPPIRAYGGGEPSLEFGFDQQAESAMMSDGTLRVSFLGTGKRSWTYSNGAITYAELQAIQGVVALRAALRFQNNWESAAWYDVFIPEFSHASISTMLGNEATLRFSVSMRVQELG